jgi:sortase A
VNRPFLNYAEAGDYNSILDISGTGIMGYVTIEKLGVELPIYHGTSEGVLQVAAGHLEGSSLPVGGEGTHSVLSAHRGLPSARLFTNLDKMEAGDTFTVTVLDRKLTYQVDQIKIVEPQEINNLIIEEGKDYCTLMTCTPYGINSHRLLVRGERISQEESGNFVTADGYLVNTSAVAIVVAIILLFWILLGLLIWQRFSWKRKKE